MRLLDFFALRNDGENSIRPSLRKIITWTIVTSIILAACVLFFFRDSKSYALFTVVTVVGAFYVSGSIIGFIFAVPKSFQNNTVPVVTNDGKSDSRINYRDNTSLEEISDWLTKIIIGLSLTQFGELQRLIREAATYIAAALQTATAPPTSSDVKFLPFCYALIVLYSAIGMVCGYLWTRIEFPKILRKKDDDLAKQKEVNRSLIRSLNNPNDPKVEMAGLVQTERSIDPAQIEIMNNILRSKPQGTDPDDPQKGRWGGKAVADNRQLTAEVTTSSIPSLYKVKIKVSSLDNTPLPGPIGIILHDTFEPMLRVLNANGQSEVFVEVIAYEAFVVGALTDVQADKEYKQLELDLNELPNLPEGFYWS